MHGKNSKLSLLRRRNQELQNAVTISTTRSIYLNALSPSFSMHFNALWGFLVSGKAQIASVWRSSFWDHRNVIFSNPFNLTTEEGDECSIRSPEKRVLALPQINNHVDVCYSIFPLETSFRLSKEAEKRYFYISSWKLSAYVYFPSPLWFIRVLTLECSWNINKFPLISYFASILPPPFFSHVFSSPA